MSKASEAQNTANHNKTNANSNLEAENRIRGTPPPLEAQTDDELDKILDKYIDARVLFPERIKADRSKAKQAIQAWHNRRLEEAVKVTEAKARRGKLTLYLKNIITHHKMSETKTDS